jgi:hypothetical protein
MKRHRLAAAVVLAPAIVAAQPYGAPRQNNLSGNYRELTSAERSVSYSGCDEVRRRGLAPLRRGEPGYRPWMDGDNDGLACEPIRDRS